MFVWKRVRLFTIHFSIFEGKLLIHLHTSLSDEAMRGFGGHLVKATVSATLEVIIEKFDTTFEKKFSEEIGLKLFDLPE